MKRHDGDRALLFENVIGSGHAGGRQLPRRARPTSRPRSAPIATASATRCCGPSPIADRRRRWSTTRRAQTSFVIERDIDLGDAAAGAAPRARRRGPFRHRRRGHRARSRNRRAQRVVPPHAAARRQPDRDQARLRTPPARRPRAGDRGGRRPARSSCASAPISRSCTPAAFMGSQMPEDADELAAAGGIQGSAAGDDAGDHQRPARAGRHARSCSRPASRRPRRPPKVRSPSSSATQSVDAAAPIMTVDAVTHRPDPIYYAISGAGRETVMLRKYVLEASALRRCQDGGADRHRRQPHGGRAVPLPPRRPGRQAQPACTTVSNATPCSRRSPRSKDLDQVIVVDDDIDPHDPARRRVRAGDAGSRRHATLSDPGGTRPRVRAGVRSRACAPRSASTPPFRSTERERFRRVPFADVALAAGDFQSASTALRVR